MPKPEKIIMVGPCRASIFRNQFVKDGKTIDIPKVVFEIRFKDKRTGQWRGTSSMSINEIPKGILALQKAFDYLLSNKKTQTI